MPRTQGLPPLTSHGKIPLFQNPYFPKSHFSKILLTLNPIFPKSHFPQIPFSPSPTVPKSHFLEGVGTYIWKYELTWRGGDIHTNEQMNLEGVTYIQTNKLGGGTYIRTNKLMNDFGWGDLHTSERTYFSWHRTPDSSFICIDVWALSLQGDHLRVR